LLQFLTAVNTEAFYSSIAKLQSLQKQCKNYPKIHGQTWGGRVIAPSPLNTPLIVTYKLHESCCNLVNIAEAIYIRRNIRFYRATSMHSADYAVARCLSVCRYSVDTAEHILNFLPPENPTIIVFLYQTVCIRRPC